MIKVVIKYSVFFFLLTGLLYSQVELQATMPAGKEKNSILNVENRDKQPQLEKSESKMMENPELVLKRIRPNPQINTTYNFQFPRSIISSFNNNFHFVGFWDKYAIINVTPQMYIKPFDFISIYANHSTSMYVPIAEVKEHFKALAFEGAAILAIDNSIKFLFSSKPVLQSLINFFAKNLAITFIKKTFEENKIPEFKYYYYAVNIRF
jgi:hypothetical protein